MSEPHSVLTAVRLMYLRAVLSLGALIVLFTTKAGLKQRILEQTPNADDSTVNAAITVGAVLGIVVLVFYLLLARQVGNGKNWARVFTWVIAALSVLGFLGGLGRPEPGPSRVFGVLGVLLDLAVAGELARPATNEYFRPRF